MSRLRIPRLVASVLALAPCAGTAQDGPPSAEAERGAPPKPHPPPIRPQTFRTPEEGFQATATAARDDDERNLIRIRPADPTA